MSDEVRRSDETVAESTLGAPSFHSPPSADGRAPAPANLDRLEEGDLIDGFEIERVLGRGAFGVVYRARDLKLERVVALKVSIDVGDEARTLANLEHENIVKVFSERIDALAGRRLICMQYVSGAALDAILKELCVREERRVWSGAALLDAVERRNEEVVALDPSALRDRQELASLSDFEAVAWVGSKLALALAHAHEQGVLHRDLKPANILVNHYGKPFLVDFSVSSRRAATLEDEEQTVGGTLAYMAPEHLESFDPSTDVPADVVDERSDIYSFGWVLFEFLTGSPPETREALAEGPANFLERLARQRKGPAPSPKSVEPRVPDAFDRVVRRCLDPEPDARYQTAGELARELDGCRRLERIHSRLPRGGRITETIDHHPFLWLVLFAVVPQLLGSVVNIAYNKLRIVSTLPTDARESFYGLVIVYNAVVYPIGLGIAIWLFSRVARAVRRTLDDVESWEDDEVTRDRRGALALPRRVAWLACLGWFPGAIFFPVSLAVLAREPAGPLFAHFGASFLISGLISATYSYFGTLFVALRVLYPKLWGSVGSVREVAARELGPVTPQLRVFQWAAAIIPLLAAILLVMLTPADLEQLQNGAFRSFQLLVTSLIVVGILGFHATLVAGRILQRTQEAFGSAPTDESSV